MTEAWIATRFVHFVAVMAAFGIGAFRLYAFSGMPSEPADTPVRLALDARLVRMTSIASLIALLSALAIIPFIASEMAGSDAAALDPGTWRAVLLTTAFGHVWRWRLVFAAALLGLCFVQPGQWQVRAATLAALLLLASLGLVGHAAADMGGGTMHELNQMAHLTAAGLWLGGLLPLGILLRRAVRADGAAYVPLARAALPHFSQIGYVAVGLLVLTGTVNSVMLVGSFPAMVETPYGRLLLVKITLFIAMIGLAFINRFRLLPRLKDARLASVSLRTLCRSVIAEQALGVAILGVVSVLGTWPPAIEAMSGMQM
jgi:putative copper resistance protein D